MARAVVRNRPIINVNGKTSIDHDLTRVIFGCDTSLIGEILLKPWILFGCDISMAELKAYADNPEVQKLNREGEALLGGKLLVPSRSYFTTHPSSSGSG